jgi:hypothetical protein
MIRKGIGAAFSDEDIEILKALWIERGKREAKAAKAASRAKERTKPGTVPSPPDRKLATKGKKLGSGESGHSPNPQ